MTLESAMGFFAFALTCFSVGYMLGKDLHTRK
ncbi:hypothetical protein SAMN05216582_10597 [Selenomonas ruminantium]|uniref:Uncharacterized protein n=1 Tax=Selenomonas ruminantium TaxID=971 RepID=A0A1M6SVN6_SELRU|nr:hypothetical protein SAMN05216582_10597 [Selenomonas ruminantium]